MNTLFTNDLTEDYIRKNSTKEPKLLRMLEEETYRFTGNPRMLSGFLQGRILSLLSRLIRPERILEIGTFTGYSALCLCEGLATGGILHTIECNDEIAPVARKYFDLSEYKNQIVFHMGDARTLLPGIRETFQLVYLDGEKKEYPEYFALVSDKISSGGLLICDNLLWNGKVFDQPEPGDHSTKAILEFTNAITRDVRFESIILPIRDGIMIARKK